jgi:DNA-binding response OmpR family regulator
VIVDRGVLAADAPVIHKPFSTHDLAAKVRAVLDGQGAGTSEMSRPE